MFLPTEGRVTPDWSEECPRSHEFERTKKRLHRKKFIAIEVVFALTRLCRLAVCAPGGAANGIRVHSPLAKWVFI